MSRRNLAMYRRHEETFFRFKILYCRGLCNDTLASSFGLLHEESGASTHRARLWKGFWSVTALRKRRVGDAATARSVSSSEGDSAGIPIIRRAAVTVGDAPDHSRYFRSKKGDSRRNVVCGPTL